MKKSLLLLLLCAGILTGCGNQALPAEPTETLTVSQTTSAVQTAENEITTTTTTEGIPEVTETCSDEISSVTTETETYTATEEIPNNAENTKITESIPNNTESTTTTAAVPEEESSEAESITSKPNVTNKVTTTTKADTKPTVTTKVTTTTKAVVTTKVTTTKKPVTTTKATTITKATTTTTVTTTVVTTTTNPDERYIEVGRNLSHDGTDYSKAKAVYDWMTVNGSGTCVNYSYQTYLVCEGIGLDCYCCWTDAGIYGHTANVVKVNGIWFVLDTQAGGFLDYNYGFTEVIDKYENHVADGSMISDYSYEELYG